MGEAAGKLKAMLDAARQYGLLESIASDGREQASSIEEVTTAVHTMDEMAQHNAALVEEINAAIEQTEAQATELDRIVDIFSTDDTAPVQRRAPEPTAASPVRAIAQGARGLQDKLKTVAKSYLSHGNAAVDKDWNEF